MSAARLLSGSARHVGSAAWVAAVAMVAAAGLLWLRLVTLEQPLNPRSLSAVGTVVAGTGLATFLWRLVVPWLRPFSAAARILVSFAIVAAGIAAMSAVLFSVVDFDLAEVEVVNSGSLARRLVHHLAAGYLMLLAGWALLFPWPLPVLAAGVALWPPARRTARPPPPPVAPAQEARPERITLALRRDR